ncbi:hypothetical protein M378DRAFT_11395 [Amanita muscaria Koide BX008]|uniref:BCS1 N-terminal domain-containing protein n=1 Tax=Amanita muscaria (strain Koide BX008) TaxID=946122 RepID=A0A0C2X5S1_AMAMK|nr:hypothetical protein M378DRAFT_11395 [Amanita muscaria Koide BX008]
MSPAVIHPRLERPAQVYYKFLMVAGNENCFRAGRMPLKTCSESRTWSGKSASESERSLNALTCIGLIGLVEWMMHRLSKRPAWSSRTFGLNCRAVLVPGEQNEAQALASNKRRLAYIPSWNQLLLEAKKEYVAAQENTISVVVSDSNNDWRHLANRPERPLTSIILDPGVKDEPIADAKEFLQSRSWYAARGIPFRRGYLLYGAPLAGELDVDIYVISLSRSGLDDTGLTELVSSLPERCIALMEDVDAALAQSFSGRGQRKQGSRRRHGWTR